MFRIAIYLKIVRNTGKKKECVCNEKRFAHPAFHRNAKMSLNCGKYFNDCSTQRKLSSIILFPVV